VCICTAGQSDLGDRTIHLGTGRSGIVSGPSGHAGLPLRDLWKARCDSGLSGIRCWTVYWRARRFVIMRGLSDRAYSQSTMQWDGDSNFPG
jgi:hypothetical protein